MKKGHSNFLCTGQNFPTAKSVKIKSSQSIKIFLKYGWLDLSKASIFPGNKLTSWWIAGVDHRACSCSRLQLILNDFDRFWLNLDRFCSGESLFKYIKWPQGGIGHILVVDFCLTGPNDPPSLNNFDSNVLWQLCISLCSLLHFCGQDFNQHYAKTNCVNFSCQVQLAQLFSIQVNTYS